MSDLVERCARVREAFAAVGFTSAGVRAVVGDAPLAAWRRDHPVPLRRALGDDHSDLATAVRLLMVGDAVSRDDLPRTLPLDDLDALGIVAMSAGSVAPRLKVHPLAVEDESGGVHDRWLVSDHLGQRPLPDDHVLGYGGAAATLTDLAARRQVDRVLDLGTGGGVQLVHLAGRATTMVGTDTNPRALQIAQLSLALSGIDADLRQGDRFEPVGGEQFDLIVSNPPLVVGPAARFEYRDSGLDGDAMCASIVANSTQHLVVGGFCQLLANWLHIEGQDWRERVTGWLPADADAWVIQRDLLDPTQYVEMWLADGGDVGTAAYDERYDSWLKWFDAHSITAVGMGFITLRRTAGVPARRLEDLRHRFEQPMGRWVPDLVETWAWEQATADADLLAARLVAAADLELAQGLVVDRAAVGGGWSVGDTQLGQTSRSRRSAPIDPFGVIVVGALDGSRTVQEALAEAAVGLGLPQTAGLREAALDAVRQLLLDGYLERPSG